MSRYENLPSHSAANTPGRASMWDSVIIVCLAQYHGPSPLCWQLVCDVNGWSFVKNSKRYYDDSAGILRSIILGALAPQHLAKAPAPAVTFPAAPVASQHGGAAGAALQGLDQDDAALLLDLDEVGRGGCWGVLLSAYAAGPFFLHVFHSWAPLWALCSKESPLDGSCALALRLLPLESSHVRGGGGVLKIDYLV